jgi:mono/diheme cytochrome c family protein
MNWRPAFTLVTLLDLSLAHAQAEKNGGTSDGERVFQQCSGCHGVKASNNNVGPALKGLFKKRYLLNGKPATEQNIRLRIKNGGDGMPPFQQILSAKELDQVIAYLKRL